MPQILFHNLKLQRERSMIAKQVKSVSLLAIVEVILKETCITDIPTLQVLYFYWRFWTFQVVSAHLVLFSVLLCHLSSKFWTYIFQFTLHSKKNVVWYNLFIHSFFQTLKLCSCNKANWYYYRLGKS